MSAHTTTPAQPIKWSSAPEITELLSSPVIVGTRAEVLACLALQRWARAAIVHKRYARRLKQQQEADELARAIVSRAMDDASTDVWRAENVAVVERLKAITPSALRHLPPTPSTATPPPPVDAGSGRMLSKSSDDSETELANPLINQVRNLDTGVALTIDEVEVLYREAPASAFSWDGRRHVALGATRSGVHAAGSDHGQCSSAPLSDGSPSVTSFRLREPQSPDMPLVRLRRGAMASPDGRASRVRAGPPGGGSSAASPSSSYWQRRERRGAMHKRALEPLMSGPLLKRGKKLGQWKLRWYTLSIEGELTCHRQRSDVNTKPPLFALSLASAQVSVMPPARLEAELAESGVFGFVLEWGGDRAASAYAHRAAHATKRELFAESQEIFAQWMRAFALLGAAAGAGVRVAIGLQEHAPAVRRGASLTSMSAGQVTLDYWGFKLDHDVAAAYQEWSGSRGKEVKRNAKQHERWARLLREEGAVESLRSSARASLELTVGGVPNSLRLRVWLRLTGVAEVMERFPQHYEDMVRQGGAMDEADLAEIEQDLHRTFPNHPLFAGSHILDPAAPPQTHPGPTVAAGKAEEPMGRAALRNVLYAYAAHNQGLGYCQALNYLGAMLLLLTEMKEEPAFWLLLHITERVAPDFYSKYMNGIRVEQNLFAEFVKAALPRLHAHFESVGLPLSIVTTSWFMCGPATNLTRPCPRTCHARARFFMHAHAPRRTQAWTWACVPGASSSTRCRPRRCCAFGTF